ncbi:RAMP superfamily CRISPR-associated protein [Haloimpatiens sp. FM7330]|uniref:RAMP superfamily CRISPR-associated protein n=1 Tax=Haloimpatiens sp. FM7330 TaxID=3298610 RepID=UPI00363E617F
MYKYPITIELLSETIFGNGQSQNGIVNTDVLLDEEGFPYYLGKTFKGCLKESINTILKPYYSKNKGDFNEVVDRLFGSNNKTDNIENEGILKFTNFYLDKEISDIFSSYEVKEKEKSEKKDLILPSLSDIRFGIKMGDNGVSESKSLRASRVLKKGLVFNGFVLSLNQLEGLQLTLLKKGIKSLKNLGINKSRGKGLVNVKIGEIVEINSEKGGNINHNFDYLLYEVDLKQPVKIGDSQSQYDYEQTKSYISGSIVRGAIIGKYLNKPQDTKKEDDFNHLLKKVYFYDAYPVYEEENNKYYSFPTPNIFRITKDRDKEDESLYKSNEFINVFDNKKVDDKPTVIKLKKGDFSYYKQNTLFQFNVKKDYRFHHSNHTKKENIFRYESISKGQKFYGVVDVSRIDKSLKKEIYNLLKRGEILYLGGSRTSGYGASEVSEIETIKDFSELKQKLQYIKSNVSKDKIDIYFLSDSILRDENHQITSSFSYKYLNKNLNLKLNKEDINNEKNINMEINPVILTGYNSTWRSCVPHVYGIEKGSVIRINLDKTKNKINEKVIEDFIKHQKGDRKQDGLGRVIINPKFLNPKNIEYKGTNNPHKYGRENSFYTLSNKLIPYIEECKNKIIIDKCIKNNTVSTLLGSKLESISKSQINNIVDAIDRSLLSEENNPMDEFKKEVERLKKTTQNSERNKRNSDILNSEILSNETLKSLLNLSDEKIYEIAKNILYKGLENVKSKESIIEEIMKQDSKSNFRKERIILNAVRDIFYYSTKTKEGEDVG